MADATEQRAKRLRELEDEEPKKGGSAAKPAKGGKDKKDKAEESVTAASSKKKHPVRNTLLLTSLVFLLLIGATIAVCRLGYVDAAGDYVYFLDPEGFLRGPILTFLNPEEQPREVYWQAELDELAERDAELTAKEDAVGARETAADEREAALDEREDTLSAREDTVNEWIDKILENNPQATGSSNDISNMVKVIAGMDPKKAALMMNEMDQDNVVRILSAMKAASSSAILDNMEPDYAAELMTLVVEPPDTGDYPDTRPGASTEPSEEVQAAG